MIGKSAFFFLYNKSLANRIEFSLSTKHDLSYGKCSVQPQVAAARSYPDGVLTPAEPPLLRYDIPHAKIPPSEDEKRLPRIPRRDLPHAAEAAQLPDRRVVAGDADVELRNLGALDRTRVPHRALDHDHSVPERAVSALDDGGGRVRELGGRCRRQDEGEVGEVERGVREAEAKLVQRLDVVLVERAVVDVEPLAEVVLGEPVEGHGRVEEVSVVALLLGDGVGETARRVHVSVEDGHEAVSTLLAGQAGVDDGGDVRVIMPAGERPDTYKILRSASAAF